jgi:glycosyltransferase involved in cell wall biosynthesis
MTQPAQPLTVSVVVPVKDDAEALARCLRLLAEQTVLPQEVIVVDNGSRDSSADVAAAHGALVVPEPAPGIPAAASRGYDSARGDVIARCDADSVPPPDWIEHILERMSTCPHLDALTGTGRFYDLPRWSAPALRRIYLGSYYVLVHAALGHTAVWGSNMALRRRTWEEVRDLVHRDDPELHDDMDLAFVLGPLRSVRYDRTLVVGVSGRSLRGSRQIHRRLRRAVRTLQVNWRVAPPWVRWRTRIGIGLTHASTRWRARSCRTWVAG